MRALFCIVLLALAGCVTPGPFHDVREIQGVSFYVGPGELFTEVQTALETYQALYGYDDEFIALNAFTFNNEVYATAEAMTIYLQYLQSKHKD